MRISDWSSDVCSSDLAGVPAAGVRARGRQWLGAGAGAAGGARASRFAGLSLAGRAYGVHDAVAGCGWGRWRRRWQCRCLVARGAFAPSLAFEVGGAEHDERHPTGRRRRPDRKSVVKGKDVSVSVDIGGRGNIKKKTKLHNI